MKKFLLFTFFATIFFLSNAQCPAGSVVIGTETFDDAANLTPTAPTEFFNDGTSDHFSVTDGTDISGAPSGYTGSFFAAEDVDDGGGGGSCPAEFTLTFNVDGFTNLSFSGLFGQPETGGFDDADDVTVSASIDGGTAQTIIDVDEIDDGDAFNQLAQIGGVQLTQAAQSFSSSITGTGTTLTLTVSVSLCSGSETIAFDDFTICGEAATLPVEYVSFNGELTNGSVELVWITASESNSSHFDIEHSSDGLNWKTLGSTAAAGDVQTQQNYSFVDSSPRKGPNFYRLKQVDLDGVYEYSEVIRIVNGDKLGFVDIRPIGGIEFELFSPDSGKLNYEIYSMNGRLVAQGEDLVNTGQIVIDAGGEYLPSGIYAVRIRINNESITEKFFKQ